MVRAGWACMCVRNTSQVNDILLVQSSIRLRSGGNRLFSGSQLLSSSSSFLLSLFILDWMQMDWLASWTFKFSRSVLSVACLSNWFWPYNGLVSPLLSSLSTLLPSVLKGTSKFIISESLQFGGKFYRKTWLIFLPLFLVLYSFSTKLLSTLTKLSLKLDQWNHLPHEQ